MNNRAQVQNTDHILGNMLIVLGVDRQRFIVRIVVGVVRHVGAAFIDNATLFLPRATKITVDQNSRYHIHASAIRLLRSVNN
ncbi:hypothetical protein IMCC3135_15495 [Granulosicoccus antarcticus IMCC3135]|uniref:Uncharacterized protein n=1 Tax=Granulosicoccus antarcticus IMCC3135 TaxID=1192854 RepID=A0A2Z2NT18_9GAMM|nr:hypothetical protein IMCC3135_15495 [Granulosicoccus antarcticus IMCC3135]